MDEQAEPPKPHTPRENPCPICGEKVYSWGSLITSNNLPDQFLFFRPLGATTEEGDVRLFARTCDRCGNVQVFYE